MEGPNWAQEVREERDHLKARVAEQTEVVDLSQDCVTQVDDLYRAFVAAGKEPPDSYAEGFRALWDRVAELESESASRMDKWEFWQAEAARRSRKGIVGELNQKVADLQENYKFEHELRQDVIDFAEVSGWERKEAGITMASDAAFAWLKARVTQVEAPQVGWVSCPECEYEFDFQTSGRKENKS